VTTAVTKRSALGIGGGDNNLQIARKAVRYSPKTVRFKAKPVRFNAKTVRIIPKTERFLVSTACISGR
jgi:hypothetical protein